VRLKKERTENLYHGSSAPSFRTKCFPQLQIIIQHRTKVKDFHFPPPPLKPRKRKAPENCNLSVIDQGTDGYSPAKLVRNSPQTNKDIYFTIRTTKTVIRSNRRNYSHRSVALYRTKKHGSTRANIEYLSCSFVEMDGSNGTVKTQEDVFTLIRENNLPKASYVIETSRGHFHVIWNYSQPLPFTAKGESYWLAQQARLIELFKQGGFLVDKGASLNPCQNLRNPSQLKPYNFKRRCKVEIHKSYAKTSLRAIYKALNATSIPNPRPMPANTKLRRYLRANQTFTLTHAELAITLGTCTKTAQREISRAVQNGDIQIVQRTGNNKGTKRATEYISKLYIEPQFSERTFSSIKDNSSKETNLFAGFQANGAEEGRRNRTVFVLAVGLSCESSRTLSVSEIADLLRGGALQSGLSEKELVRTIKNAVKPAYSNPFSRRKVAEWGLLQGNDGPFQIACYLV